MSLTNPYYAIETNGILSKTDLYFNGVQLASKETLNGAYGGQRLDIPSHIINGTNIILIRVYPTDYLTDFGIGFGDWNPSSPDKGTGIWRKVRILQSGAVALGKPRITTDYVGKATALVTVSVTVLVMNKGNGTVQGRITGQIEAVGGSGLFQNFTAYTLTPGESKTVRSTMSIQNPQIWWPRLWGMQPLYTLSTAAYIGSNLSDCAEQRTFGIRHITSSLNHYNDTAFWINGHSFQVRGAGYAPDVFLRFNDTKVAAQLDLILDIGLNTIRLEGKLEQPELYAQADRKGLMILAGWECCDKWEAWAYNDNNDGAKWVDADYETARVQMEHEATMLQGHPSVLAFAIGRDSWPDERAAKIYVDVLRKLDWDVPIVASAGMLGWPEELGPSGMKMGPYDWVPPNYWYGDQLGAAFGFGSELSAGAGTPELTSVQKFLSPADLDDLWTSPNKGIFHMATEGSVFHNRGIYNAALYARYGPPSSLDDYLLKAQMSDYEATRAQFEAYSVRRNAERPATGLVYWMANNAWPSLHWNLFDYYLKGAGSYYGAKTGLRSEHVVFEYGTGSIWVVSHRIDSQGGREVAIELMGCDGSIMVSKNLSMKMIPNRSQHIPTLADATITLREPAFLRLVLREDDSGMVLSRNVYWLSPALDVLDWDNSTWYNTPVMNYADYTSMFSMAPARITLKPLEVVGREEERQARVLLHNTATVPAWFVRLKLADRQGEELQTVVVWEDNYMTLWPGEELVVGVTWKETKGVMVKVKGLNIVENLEGVILD